MLKILVRTHHGYKHLLQQTVVRTLKRTVEAATSMIVATPKMPSTVQHTALRQLLQK